MESLWYCYISGKKSGPYSDEQMIDMINNQQLSDNDDFINENYSLDVLSLEDAKGYLFHLKVQGDLPAGYPAQTPPYPPIAYQNQAQRNAPISKQARDPYMQQKNKGMKTRNRCVNCGKKLAADENSCLRCGTPKNITTNNRKKPMVIATAIIAPVVLVTVLFTAKYAVNKLKIGINDIKQEIIAANVQASIKQESIAESGKNLDSVGKGSFKGRTYYNSDLGLKYTIPEGLIIGTSDQVAKIDEKIGLNGGLRVFVARYKLYSMVQYNDNSKLYVEKKPLLFSPSLDEYAESLKTEMVTSNPGLVFEENLKISINGVEFVVLKGKYRTLSQESYITTRNGYYVDFLNAYESNKTKALFDKMIYSVTFG